MTTTQKKLDIETIRADFPIMEKVVNGKPLIYFDNAATTQRPNSVIQAVSECYSSSYANVHRGIHALSELATELYEDSRRCVQRFINAELVEQIIFTSGTTAAINIVANSLGASFKPGDEIVLTQMEHHSNIVPWQQVAERSGANVLFARVTDDGQLDLEHLESLLSEKTQILAVTAVSNVLGTVNPVEQLVVMARKVNAKILIDAAQAVPHAEVDVQKWDADFVAFSGHKMLGPSGVGILYGKRELLEAMPPFLGGGSMISTVSEEGFTPGELPAKFEAGTPPITQAIALKPAIEYLEQVGLEAIQAHELMLAKKTHELISDIPDLKILGPEPELKAGIVSFVIGGINVQDLSLFIDRYGVAIRGGHHCAMPLHKRYGIPASSRASFYLYNTLEEVEAFNLALRQVIKKLK